LAQNKDKSQLVHFKALIDSCQKRCKNKANSQEFFPNLKNTVQRRFHMRLLRNDEIRKKDEMIANMKFANETRKLSEKELHEILHTSFWNTLLRFIVIDGKEYSTNSMMHIRGGVFLRYTNPHEKDVRVSYNNTRQILFIEKMEMVPHPFTCNQRMSGDDYFLCSFFGYKAMGWTDPDEKVQQWNKVDEGIPISKIKSLKIESFWDRPAAIWYEGKDYTAYKIIVTLKKR
jgi:hypothetical protein